MISHTIFVWFFSFSSTSDVVPVVLYYTKKGKTFKHAQNIIITPKEEWKLELNFTFELKNPRELILWRRL